MRHAAAAAVLVVCLTFVAAPLRLCTAVRVGQQRRRRHQENSHGEHGERGYRHPLHVLGPVHARFLAEAEPIPAVVVAPDVVVNPGDENDVPVSPTIVDTDRPLHDDVEIQIPMDGRLHGLAAAAGLGVDASALAEMTTLEKIHALLPAAKAEVADQVEEVASLASGLFADAKDMLTRSMTNKVEAQVEHAKLEHELDAAKDQHAVDQAEIARLRKELGRSKAHQQHSVRAAANLQKKLDELLASNIAERPATGGEDGDGHDEDSGAVVNVLRGVLCC
eukprot:INCI4278.1.p2 GENE.INCI4278.1~~INCI4278.1.p2  ORF type:complete len:278 (+),score=57.79 INCI4278.1:116-949(+)